MQNRYKFMGGNDFNGRMFVYATEMKEHDLSSAAIRDFAKAIKDGDLDSIKHLFKELNDNQKTGLLNLYIDYNDMWGGFLNLHAPMGYPSDLAKNFGHENILAFIEEEITKLTPKHIYFEMK